jgi:hypothetical protein
MGDFDGHGKLELSVSRAANEKTRHCRAFSRLFRGITGS